MVNKNIRIEKNKFFSNNKCIFHTYYLFVQKIVKNI